ncbi:MAG: thioredoxin family protein [Bacteroidota bacterium]|nr:thioredoxin family protein [Bacteroidota bacterium]
MKVKILGSGCAKCNRLTEKVKEVAEKNNIQIEVEKITDIQEIVKSGIMMTPGLVINEKVKSYGIIPKDDEILNFLKEA